MLPYWLLYLYFAIGALTTALSSRERQPAAPGGPATGAGGSSSKTPLNLAFVVGIIGVALMIGLRFEVGTDWHNYAEQFEATKRFSFSRAIVELDPAYGAINWLAIQAGAGIWLVNLTCGSLFACGLAYFAKSQPNPWLMIAVAVPYLVIVVGMGYTRQAVAIGLGMIALVAVCRESFLRFVLWVFAAAMFHSSAVILIPIVALAYSRNLLHSVFLVAAGTVIGYLVLRGDNMEHFQRIYVNPRLSSQGAAIRISMNCLPAILFLLLPRRFSPNEVERRIFSYFAVLALISVGALFLMSSTTAVDRLALYLIPLQLLVFSRLPRVLAPNTQLTMTALVIAYSALIQLIWLGLATNSRNWIPYSVYPMGG